MDIFDIALANIRPELLLLVPIMWYIGTMFKGLPDFKNYLIPFALTAVSVLLSVIYMMLFIDLPVAQGIWVGVVQGLLITMVESTLYTYYEQFKRRKE
jgi:hypothetical protein